VLTRDDERQARTAPRDRRPSTPPSRHAIDLGSVREDHLATPFEPTGRRSAVVIDRAAFDAWHAGAVQGMTEREPRLTDGWGAKIASRSRTKSNREAAVACGEP
jgi:hypothetical protein